MATPEWLDPEHHQSNDGLVFAQESWLAWTRVPLTVVSELRLTLSELLRVAEARPANADTDWWADCKSLLKKSESLCQAADVSPPILFDASPQTAAGEYRQGVWFEHPLQGYSSAWWKVDLFGGLKIRLAPKYFTSRQVMRGQCVDCLKTWLAVLDDVIAAASPSDETPDAASELQAGPAVEPVDAEGDGEATGDKNQETRIPVCQSKKVKLFGPGEQPEVNGKRKPILTPARYDAVKALIEAGGAGLTKDQLDSKSGHPDARKLLKALADEDVDWEKAIPFPGTPGKRYRIR